MKFRNEKGITLIEAVAATVILSMVVLTFVTLSGSVSKADHSNDTRNEALRIAELNLNYARDYFSKNNGVPSGENINQYSIKIQLTNLMNEPDAYNTSEFGANHVSLQSIAYHKNRANQPQLITVTVSWGNGS
jgi:type II secretory pathway pseudopilin PulG